MGFGKLSMPAEEKVNLLQEKITDITKNQIERGVLCVISGMASSSIGLRTLDYGKLPISLLTGEIPYDQLDQHTYLLSGLATAEDVMRGEETQIFGTAGMSSFAGNTLAILPGTHSKHAWLEDGTLTDFKTFMSGELFSLLGTHSILSHSLDTQGNINAQSKAFLKGLERSAGAFLHELFAIRARHVLQNSPDKENGAFLSGLLIGSELRAIPRIPGLVCLIADGTLEGLYKKALQTLYPKTPVKTFSTEEATIRGQWQFIQKRI